MRRAETSGRRSRPDWKPTVGGERPRGDTAEEDREKRIGVRERRTLVQNVLRKEKSSGLGHLARAHMRTDMNSSRKSDSTSDGDTTVEPVTADTGLVRVKISSGTEQRPRVLFLEKDVEENARVSVVHDANPYNL